MIPRYVLDTDVVVAALRSDRGASRQLLRAALLGSFRLLVSVPLLLEYEAVLTRPEQLAAFGLKTAEIGRLLDGLSEVAEQVLLTFRWRPSLPDPDDDMVLETAVSGSADAIVTFNLRHFELASRQFDCAVLLPRAALRELRSFGHET